MIDKGPTTKTATPLERLYGKIPSFTCKAGCGDCCGIVPWSPAEWARVADRLPADATATLLDGVVIPTRASSTRCPFFSGGCTVYEDRPFMCRLFGTARDARLTCPKGCQPTHLLAKTKARKLTTQYQKEMGI